MVMFKTVTEGVYNVRTRSVSLPVNTHWGNIPHRAVAWRYEMYPYTHVVAEIPLPWWEQPLIAYRVEPMMVLDRVEHG